MESAVDEKPRTDERPRSARWGPRRGGSTRLDPITRFLVQASPAIGIYLAIRVTAMAMLWIVRRPERGWWSWWPYLGRGDAGWYLSVATDGYRSLHSHTGLSGEAFFPLYPALARTLDVGPVGTEASMVLVTVLGGMAAAAGLYAVGAQWRDRRTGIAMAALWAAAPNAVVLSLGYTEALFTAFAVWALYAARNGRWVTAGVLCSAAGLTRPTGVAVMAGVAVFAALALADVRRRTRGAIADGSPAPGPAAVAGPVAGLLIAMLGWSTYVLTVGWTNGSISAYFDVQDRWGSRLDGGAYTVGLAVRFGQALVEPDPVLPMVGAVVVLGMIAAAAVLLVWCLKDRVSVGYLAYAAVLLGLAVTSSGFPNAKARFLLTAFPLLLPVAARLAALSRRRPATALVVGFAVAAASAYLGYYTIYLNPWAP